MYENNSASHATRSVVRVKVREREHGGRNDGFQVFFFSRLGPTDEDCQACSAGFLFNDKDRKCLSLCPNGNYFDQGEQVSTSSSFPVLTEPDEKYCL